MFLNTQRKWSANKLNVLGIILRCMISYSALLKQQQHQQQQQKNFICYFK